MSDTKAILTINGKDHEVIHRKDKHGVLVNAKICNELRNSNDPWFSLVVGGFIFLSDEGGEGRAEIDGELVLEGQYPTLEEAEEAGEAAMSSKGRMGVFGDSYLIPEAANTRVIEG